MSTQPVFGKRKPALAVPPVRPASAAVPLAAPIDQAAFFAALRAEAAEKSDERRIVVPLSFKAAFLAGLVVGCGLVGFDLTGSEATEGFTRATSALGLNVQVGGSLLPAMMLLGLLGGARSAALNLVLVHGLLRARHQTSHLAYALGGAAAAAVLAGAFLALFGHAPSHGWAVDLLAGGAGGLLYRVFAGTRPA